jgi:hypothetical protein
MKPFYGELRIEDAKLGNKSLYVLIGENIYGELTIGLHNANPPNNIATLIGEYDKDWILLRIKKHLLVTEWKMALFTEQPPLEMKCVTGHKFGDMLAEAINQLYKEMQNKQSS